MSGKGRRGDLLLTGTNIKSTIRREEGPLSTILPLPPPSFPPGSITEKKKCNRSEKRKNRAPRREQEKAIIRIGGRRGTIADARSFFRQTLALTPSSQKTRGNKNIVFPQERHPRFSRSSERKKKRRTHVFNIGVRGAVPPLPFSYTAIPEYAPHSCASSSSSFPPYYLHQYEYISGQGGGLYSSRPHIYPDMKEKGPRKKWVNHETANPPPFCAEGYPMSFLN